MSRTINPLPTRGPYVIEVTVKSGDGEKRNVSQVGDALLSTGGNLEDMVAYSAAKAGQRAFRSICWELVRRENPALQQSDKELNLIWRATIAGKEVTIKTAEEIAADNAAAKEDRYGHLWCASLQIGYALGAMQRAIYELWRAIRG